MLRAALRSLDGAPRLQFALLQVVVRGELNGGPDGDPMGAEALSLALDAADRALYLHLLAHYAPEDVYDYVVRHDDYSLDECLGLCRRLRITDASVYLLERSGDAAGALRMMLRALHERASALAAALASDRIRALLGDGPRKPLRDPLRGGAAPAPDPPARPGGASRRGCSAAAGPAAPCCAPSAS